MNAISNDKKAMLFAALLALLESLRNDAVSAHILLSRNGGSILGEIYTTKPMTNTRLSSKGDGLCVFSLRRHSHHRYDRAEILQRNN
jgi:hypothetical protein